MKAIYLTLALVAATATQAAAVGTMEKACLSSHRNGSSKILCSCIQQAANKTLNGSDQRMAAGFFKNPEKAEEIRMSDRSSHEEFWQRYKRFGAIAQQFCSG